MNSQENQRDMNQHKLVRQSSSIDIYGDFEEDFEFAKAEVPAANPLQNMGLVSSIATTDMKDKPVVLSKAARYSHNEFSDNEVEVVGVFKSSENDTNEDDRKIAARPSGRDHSALRDSAVPMQDKIIDLTDSSEKGECLVGKGGRAAHACTYALEKSSDKAKKAAEARDEETARALAARFKQEEDDFAKTRVEHQAAMLRTSTGKAFAFVEGVLAVHERLAVDLQASQDFIKPIGRDDIVALTEKLLLKQEEFRIAGKHYGIDLGYHYTQETNLHSIQTGGLLTKKERDSLNIVATHNGSMLGDGIYTANGPFDTWNQTYGNVGLIVCRLFGNLQTDTVISGTYAVLRTSAQCVALMQYDGKQLSFHGTNCCFKTVLEPYARSLQDLVDKLLNEEGASLPPELETAKTLSLRPGVAHRELPQSQQLVRLPIPMISPPPLPVLPIHALPRNPLTHPVSIHRASARRIKQTKAPPIKVLSNKRCRRKI